MQRDYLAIILHSFLWLLAFLYPLFSLEDISNTQYIINRNWLSISSIFLVFYINYFVLVNQFFFKSKKLQFYIVNILLIATLFFLIRYFLKWNAFNPSMNGLRIREVRSGEMSPIQLILPMILSVGMCVGLKINAKLNKNQLVLQQVKQAQLDAEIKYLKYQVQPHFLFNTLNNIYALIDSSPVIAKESIHSLSKMMRYLLHDSSVNKVPLVKEIEFLERYIDLMLLRISSNLKLEKNFPIINQPIQIAPLILVSFIENAFKHGIDAVQTSFIKVELKIDNDEIQYSVINSSFPEKGKVTNSGIGLDNLKKRLELLYPNKFELITKEVNSKYIATLILNFKK